MTDVTRSFTDGHLHLDVPSRSVSVDGDDVRLTPLEFRLLLMLVQHEGELLDSGRLCELVWDDPTGEARDHVKLYVGYLRRKLAPLGPDDWAPIENVRGHGYRYRYPISGRVAGGPS